MRALKAKKTVLYLDNIENIISYRGEPYRNLEIAVMALP